MCPRRRRPVDGCAGSAATTPTPCTDGVVEAAISIDRELLAWLAVHGTAPGAGPNLLAGAALGSRERFRTNVDLSPSISTLAREPLPAAATRK